MPIPSFIETRFPTEISFGSSGGPGFNTDVFTAASGSEQRTLLWSESRAEYNITTGIRDKVDMDKVVAMFFAVRGRGVGFRFKDWADYQIALQNIGIGNGVLTQFQLVKSYTFGAETYTRTIRKPVAGTVTGVTVNGVPKTLGTDFTVDTTTGILTFTVAPANTHVVFVGAAEFDVPVRFDIDKLPVSHEAWQIESLSSIPLVEIRPR
jgi:uncharacterized protein (TIGR02217 family)